MPHTPALNAIAPLVVPTLLCMPILGIGVVHAASSDEQAVTEVVNQLRDAWNRHDMNAFGALFAPDADFVNVTATHWHGRAAIQLNHAFLHGTISLDSPGVALPKAVYGIFKTSVMSIKQIDVRFLRKDVAAVQVQTEMAGDARTQNLRRSFLTIILTQEGGRWLIAVAQNTEINRPPEVDR
jgi:hypothetical protein